MIYLGIAVWASFTLAICVGTHRWAKMMEAYDKQM